MGASSREFLMMRMEEETGALYVPTLSKKEIKAKAVEDAKALMDSGESYIHDAVIDASRILEYLKPFVDELRKKVDAEKYKDFECKGVKFSFKGTGDRLDYDQDEKYAEIKTQLKEREDLLKVAYKSKEMIFDSEGVEVPKIGLKSVSKEVLNLTF
jgi:hypothetical protein